MIHYFPLEPSDERWTGFMDKLITERLQRRPYRKYNPYLEPSGAERDLAAFYDPARVMQYRAEQLALFFYGYGSGDVRKGDMLFFTDLFVPGVEAVAYAAQLAGGPNVDIRGLVHAGSFTDHDLMNKAERWASLHENLVLDLCSHVYVGSRFIRDDMYAKRLVSRDPDKVVVTGFPLDPDLDYITPQMKREPIVVFNGRLSPEKQPELFERLQDELEQLIAGGDEIRFVNCIAEGLSKPDYYDLLSRARVVVSFARQETFGTAIQEAVRLGCVPVVPNCCCYPEQFALDYLYDTFDEAVTKTYLALGGRLPVPDAMNCSDAVERWLTP